MFCGPSGGISVPVRSRSAASHRLPGRGQATENSVVSTHQVLGCCLPVLVVVPVACACACASVGQVRMLPERRRLGGSELKWHKRIDFWGFFSSFRLCVALSPSTVRLDSCQLWYLSSLFWFPFPV